MVTVLGANEALLPHYSNLWQLVKNYFTPFNSSDDITSCLNFANSLIETYNRNALFVVNDVLAFLERILLYDEEFCRSNGLYFISLVVTHFVAESEPYLNTFTTILQSALEVRIGDVFFIHSFNHSFTHSFTLENSLTHSLIGRTGQG